MSFILDALRKSETERQKSEVPKIGDVPLVVHRNQLPRWTVGVIAGLCACVGWLVWAWLRDAEPSAPPDDASVAAAPTASSASASGVAPVARQSSEIRDLSVEAQQATGSAASGGVEDSSASPAVARPLERAVSAAPIRTLAQFRASGGALPAMNLELHVYSTSAAERFVFINSAKYVEGDTLAEGARLGAITEEGAVLVYQGQSLLLSRE